MHREDVKAALRKKFGSLLAFEAAKGLPAGSVVDILRGRASAVTEHAIAEALNRPLHQVFPRRYSAVEVADSSIKTDDSTPVIADHRLTARAV